MYFYNGILAIEPSEFERAITEKTRELSLSNNTILSEIIIRVHYIEKFIYSLKKFEINFINFIQNFENDGKVVKSMKKIPIYYDIRDMLVEGEVLKYQKLQDLSKQFIINNETSSYSSLLGQEVWELREKAR